MLTIPRLFRARVAATPARRAFSSFLEGAWRDFTWLEYEAQARAFGLGLREMGLRRGDVVAILGQTRHEWAVCDVGALGVGGITVGLYPTLPLEGIGSLRYLIDHSEASVVVVESAATFAQKIAPLLPKLSHIRSIILWDYAATAPASDARIVALAEVMALGDAAHGRDPEAWARACDAANPDDLALLIYTSGTTGDPKGAMLTHRNLCAAQSALAQVMPKDDEGGRTVSFLPFAHVAERSAGLYNRICEGTATHFAGAIDTLFDDIAYARPTHFGAVPRIFEKVYASVRSNHVSARDELAATRPFSRDAIDPEVRAAVRARFGGECQWLVTGAAPIAPAVLEFFDACGLPTYEAYGLTESTGVLTINRPGATKYGTVGPPLSGVELRIADDGEVLARGPQVFSGYFKDAEATAEALRDGWLFTGDIGAIDADGFLTISDRKKDILITSGGKNIAPSNIEHEVSRSPLILRCHLHADRRPYPVALVCLDPECLAAFADERALGGSTAEQLREDPVVRAHVEEIIARANSKVARFEQIRKFEILRRDFSIDEGELTPTMKVKRKQIDRLYAPLLDSMYAESGSERR